MRAGWFVVSALAGAITMKLLDEPATAGRAAQDLDVPRTAATARTEVSVDRATLRREIDAALRDSLGNAAPARQIADASDTPPSPTSDQLDAERTATMVIDDAIARGRWTSDDQHRLDQQLGMVHPDAQEAILLTWASAVNDQKLALEPRS